MLNRASTITIWLGNIVLLLGLALMAYLGFYNRYWADDWCYSADARQQGTVGATLQYFNPEGTGYSSNRYSLTLFSALTENVFGMFGNHMVAATTIVLWFVGLFWIFWNLSRLIKPIHFSIILLATGLLLYYNLYLSPQRFQVLYWRSGVLPYSTALVLWVLILGFITYQMTRERPVRWFNYIVAPLGFLAAGLGEISATLLFSGTTILLIAIWYFKNKGYVWAGKSFQTLLTAWLFILIGMIALIISPSNARLENMGVNQSDPLTVPFVSLRHGFDFINFSLRGLPLPHIIFLGMIFALAVISTNGSASNLTVKRVAILLAFTSLVTYVLIVVIQAPTAYFYSSIPEPRSQSLSRFILLCGLAIMAWATGVWVAEKITSKWLVLASLLVMLAGFGYTARSIRTIYSELAGFEYRARIWDERDAIVESEKAQGNMLIEVPVIDTAQIDTRDIFGSRGIGWTQFSLNCAARYYGVEGLKVDQD